MSKNTSVAAFSNSLNPGEQQPMEATVQTGVVASLSLKKPATFLHEE